MSRCLGCMYEYGDEYEVCPKCGYIKNTKPEYAYFIETGKILHERYMVGRAIGNGGFGITYIGWDTVLNHKIAIKEYFPREFATRVSGQTHVSAFSGERGEQFEQGKQGFIEEARRLARFNQTKGVVHIYDYFEENDTAYIIMEYVGGQTYRQRMKKKGTIPVREALDVTIQVLETLEKVHEEGIIHRDIAPDNIMLNEDGEVTILDFGASRFATTKQSKSLSVVLKQGFAPEEQYYSRGKQGPWTDVYAVAATFYKMVTGKTPQSSIERRVNDQVVKPSKLGVQIPKNLENAIMNAMNVRIEDRTQTAKDFLNALHADKVKRKKEKMLFTDIGRWPLWTKIVFPILGVGIAVFLALMATGVIHFEVNQTQTSVLAEGKTVVPSVVNMSYRDATQLLKDSNLNVRVARKEYTDSVTSNLVLDQKVAAGEIVDANSVVSIVLSARKEDQKVPDVCYMGYDEAVSALEEMGIEYTSCKVYSIDAPDTVIYQNIPAERKVTDGMIINLLVSDGLPSIDPEKKSRVPNFSKQYFDDATKLAEENGLYLLKEPIEDYTKPLNYILEQDVKSGETVQQGSVVSVKVNTVRGHATVPNVVGKDAGTARRMIEDSLLKAVLTYRNDNNVPEGQVIDVYPYAGYDVDFGSEVHVTVSSGKPYYMKDVTVPNLVGMSAQDAMRTCERLGLGYSIYGFGTVTSQDYAPGASVRWGTMITIMTDDWW